MNYHLDLAKMIRALGLTNAMRIPVAHLETVADSVLHSIQVVLLPVNVQHFN